MRLALLIYGSLDTISGGYLYDRKLVEYLRGQGDTVEIISIPWRNYAAHLTDNFSPALYRRLKAFRGDILIQDELNHPSLFLLNRRLRNTDYAITSIVHHLRASEQHPAGIMPLYRAVERAYLCTLTGFVFNSRTTQRAVGALMGQEVARSVVAVPAGDRLPINLGDADIRQRGMGLGPLRLLFVGNVIPRKGLHTVLAALARVVFPWTLDVAGDLRVASDYVRGLQEEVARRGWGRREGAQQVKFWGAVTDEALARLASGSQVLVMPSSYEGYGIVYLEGMGFGLPAIGTTAGAAGEIITDGVDGFLIAPEDAESLAERLRELDENRARLVAMSLAAQRRYAAHPTWEASMAQIREFLSRLL
ncbi:MAG: glycosyltransferase family 4 protein [Anaerolineales bacterium]|nr:glycosyltransferase family 4 protein [Anaerolineales bacterium]